MSAHAQVYLAISIVVLIQIYLLVAVRLIIRKQNREEALKRKIEQSRALSLQHGTVE
jgi:hypothetical protein